MQFLQNIIITIILSLLDRIANVLYAEHAGLGNVNPIKFIAIMNMFVGSQPVPIPALPPRQEARALAAPTPHTHPHRPPHAQCLQGAHHGDLQHVRRGEGRGDAHRAPAPDDRQGLRLRGVHQPRRGGERHETHGWR